MEDAGDKMQLKISGHSTALYSTFWFVDQLRLMFDCGDGAAAFLQQKGRKVRTIVCSHADRDHLSGLHQFLQVNSQTGSPRVLYPDNCGSFPAIRDFLTKFDPHLEGLAEWQGINDGDRIDVRKSTTLECYANRHVPHAADSTKSLSFSLVQTSRKLKPEFLSLTGPEIGQLIAERGEAEVTTAESKNILTYSADTPIEPPEFWRNPQILIHECTFLKSEDANRHGQNARHCVLEDVLKMASQMKLQALILGHFSVRYAKEQIIDRVKAQAAVHAVPCPIWVLPPGESEWDILATKPVWDPSV